jgi:hypothetical protein
MIIKWKRVRRKRYKKAFKLARKLDLYFLPPWRANINYCLLDINLQTIFRGTLEEVETYLKRHCKLLVFK